MHKIKAYDDKAMRKSTKIAAIIMGIGLIVFGFFSTVKYSAIIGIILLLAVLMQKETYVTEEGIDVEYDFIVHKHVISWKFDEISDIHIEEPADRNYRVLHFLRGAMSRRLIFRRNEFEEVIQMATDRNKEIHVEQID